MTKRIGEAPDKVEQKPSMRRAEVSWHGPSRPCCRRRLRRQLRRRTRDPLRTMLWRRGNQNLAHHIRAPLLGQTGLPRL